MNLDVVVEEVLPHPVDAVWAGLGALLRDGWPGRIDELRRTLERCDT